MIVIETLVKMGLNSFNWMVKQSHHAAFLASTTFIMALLTSIKRNSIKKL
jgi:hypothetical protein